MVSKCVNVFAIFVCKCLFLPKLQIETIIVCTGLQLCVCHHVQMCLSFGVIV